jgi:NADH:ubiquinone oxidoreductase subunit E
MRTVLTKINIKICLGSSCFARGNKQFVKVVKEYLQTHGLEAEVDFRGAHCFATCHLGPVIEINDQIYEKLTEQKLLQLLDDTFHNTQKS